MNSLISRVLSMPVASVITTTRPTPAFLATAHAYWIASGRRIVLLTVFAKTRMREVGEVQRARRALARCLADERLVEDGDD